VYFSFKMSASEPITFSSSSDDGLRMDSDNDDEVVLVNNSEEEWVETGMNSAELIEHYNLDELQVRRNFYAFGDPTDEEYQKVQNFFGNKAALNELDTIVDLITHFLDSRDTDIEWVSAQMINAQVEILTYLGMFVDLTGYTSDIPKLSASLKRNFDLYTKAYYKFTKLYKENWKSQNAGKYLVNKSDWFLKLFCEAALDKMVALRVSRFLASSGSSSAAAPAMQYEEAESSSVYLDESSSTAFPALQYEDAEFSDESDSAAVPAPQYEDAESSSAPQVRSVWSGTRTVYKSSDDDY